MSARAADALADIPGVWRGLDRARAGEVESTGLPQLDHALLGGWPVGALSQLVSVEPGLGFSLMVPLLARLTRTGHEVALVSPPHVPYAPALRAAGVDLERLLWLEPQEHTDALWATEQMLRSGLYAAVVLWSAPLATAVERRLQLAAETGRGIGILAHAGHDETRVVAAVRLAVCTAPGHLRVEVLRCRGARPGRRVDFASNALQVA